MACDLKKNGLNSIKRVVWALDPFAGEQVDSTADSSAAPPPGHTAMSRVERCLHAFAANGLDIYPVYVLGPGPVNFLMGGEGDHWLEDYEPLVRERLTKSLAESTLSIKSPEVLLEPRTTIHQAVQCLLDYAKTIQADSIVVSSHLRGTMSKVFLGSFAESLLDASRIPVLVVGPKSDPSPEIHTILVPATLRVWDSSKHPSLWHGTYAFRRAVLEALEFGARIVLFHALPQPIEPMLQSGATLLGGSWVPVQAFFSDGLDRQKRHLEAWARWGRNQGVEIEPCIEIFGGSIAESILRLSERHRADLIVMDADSGTVASRLIGSITHSVLRHAQTPVWVVRAPDKAAVLADPTLSRAA